MVKCNMTQDSINFLKVVKYSATTLAALMVAGIVTLMVLARGTGEDITGIVVPALLITFASIVAAIIASILQARAEGHRDETESAEVANGDQSNGAAAVVEMTLVLSSYFNCKLFAIDHGRTVLGCNCLLAALAVFTSRRC